MDPTSIIAQLLFSGLGSVTDLFNPLKKLQKLFSKNSQYQGYDLMTPFGYADPLQMYYASLFNSVHSAGSGFVPPYVIGYPPGFVPAYPTAYPYFQPPQYYQQPQSSSSSFAQQHFPTFSRLFSGSSSSGSSHHFRDTTRSASFSGTSYHQPPSSGFSGGGSTIQLIKPQEAGDTYIDDGVGLSTGGNPHFTNHDAIAHWNMFQRSGCTASTTPTVAVLDWTAGLITMYVLSGHNLKYFRNYRISQVDVTSFASTFKNHEVCSGIVRHQKLEAINRPMSLILDRGQYGRFISNNCWTYLGLPCPKGELEEMGPAFVETARGAVFGIINCLYTAPHRLNVDMKRVAPNLDCVHIDCLGRESALGKNPASDCAFTVFEFFTNGWAHEKVLVG